MNKINLIITGAVFLTTTYSCSSQQKKDKEETAKQPTTDTQAGGGMEVTLPAPYAGKVVENYSDVNRLEG